MVESNTLNCEQIFDSVIYFYITDTDREKRILEKDFD